MSVVAGGVLDVENIFAVVEVVDAGYESFVSVWQAVKLLVFAADSQESDAHQAVGVALHTGELDESVVQHVGVAVQDDNVQHALILVVVQ